MRRYDQNVKNKYKDEYRVYVFYTIERDLLDRQVLDVIDRTAADSKVNTDQKAAIDKVKSLIRESGL